MEQSLVMAGAVPTDVPPPPDQIAVAQSSERDRLLRDIGSGLKLTNPQKKILRREATVAQLDLLPSGEIYVPGAAWRALLNEAFDPAGWGILPGKIHQHVVERASSCILYREVFLMVARCAECLKSISACACEPPIKTHRVCVATAIGAQKYHAKNARMTLDDAAEGATTNGIMRCGKVLGIFANIWDKTWAEQARDEIGIVVNVRDWDGKINPQWRRWDRKPFNGEQGLAPGTINVDKYQGSPVVPPAPEKPARAATAPREAPQPVPATLDAAVLVKSLRRIESEKLWAVHTDGGDYVTTSDEVFLGLESCRSKQQRTELDVEVFQTSRGSRNNIVSIRPVRAKKG